jgi:hypothetical protein
MTLTRIVCLLLLIVGVSIIFILDMSLRKSLGGMVFDVLGPVVGFILGFLISRSKAKKKEKMIVAPYR